MTPTLVRTGCSSGTLTARARTALIRMSGMTSLFIPSPWEYGIGGVEVLHSGGRFIFGGNAACAAARRSLRPQARRAREVATCLVPRSPIERPWIPLVTNMTTVSPGFIPILRARLTHGVHMPAGTGYQERNVKAPGADLTLEAFAAALLAQ